MKETKAGLLGKGKRFAIIVSRFNEIISKRLLEGAIDCLIRHGVADEDIEVFWTPGSYEIPFVANRLLDKGYHGLICLGAVIRGETPHFDYIAAEVAKGIAAINLKGKIPVSFGIITADNIDQAIDRAGAKEGNKGFDAALSALEMVNLCDKI
ncbi:6,7-dimethyl-8-ribityllumazine synthase [candidate division WOR-3 bacterium]|mgnify:CR=1 FL=1|uniref:6,7-dimethyl-8-ribityllumazine synthase n=1 Tax=candidate division WOR-3 bacterium TaxID=2052148 RepID=A0A660SLX0_UNCW3|nr:MAG: 6,7-dimethyl-8-ribityllumazine synthase [candidate division WOR-3 bacterium]